MLNIYIFSRFYLFCPKFCEYLLIYDKYLCYIYGYVFIILNMFNFLLL